MFWNKNSGPTFCDSMFIEVERSNAELRKRLELDLVTTIQRYSDEYGLNIEDILFYCDKTIDVRVDLKNETSNTQAETTGTENTKAE